MFHGAIGQFALGQFLQATHVEFELGTYNLTGLDATLTKQGAVTIDLDLGAYTVTGQPATLTKQSLIELDTGSYSLTGQTVTLTRGYQLSADAGAYTLTGLAATLAKSGSFVLLPELGVYNLTGYDATLAGRTARDDWTVTVDITISGTASITCTEPYSATVETN